MTDWYLDTTRIFVQDLRGDDDQIVARLNPLGGGTTLHFFGYDEDITKVSALIVGFTDRDALIAMSRAPNTAYTMSSPWGTWGSFFVKHVAYQLTSMICQTIRPDLPENSPVFKVDLDLYKNE